jgi:hypothetical protein
MSKIADVKETQIRAIAQVLHYLEPLDTMKNTVVLDVEKKRLVTSSEAREDGSTASTTPVED